VLNSAAVRDAIVDQLRKIKRVVEFMNGKPELIRGHLFAPGVETSLTRAVAAMTAPGILIAFKGQVQGAANEQGASLVKHQFDVFVRIGNLAGDQAGSSYEDLWHSMVNDLPQDSPVNIRYITLLPETEIMDTPYPAIVQDEDGNDFLRAVFSIPEIGDN